MKKTLEKVVQALYLLTAMGLAFFCLFQSERIAYDQRARDLAGQLHMNMRASNPLNSQNSLEGLKKKIGEESD